MPAFYKKKTKETGEEKGPTHPTGTWILKTQAPGNISRKKKEGLTRKDEEKQWQKIKRND